MGRIAVLFALGLMAFFGERCHSSDVCWDLLAGHTCNDFYGDWPPNANFGCDSCRPTDHKCLNYESALRTAPEVVWEQMEGVAVSAETGYSFKSDMAKTCALVFSCLEDCQLAQKPNGTWDYECVKINVIPYGYWYNIVSTPGCSVN